MIVIHIIIIQILILIPYICIIIIEIGRRSPKTKDSQKKDEKHQ